LKALLQKLGVALVLLFVAGFWLAPAFGAGAHPKARKPVRFWHMWTAEWKDVVDKIVVQYNASQDEYEVEALSVPSAGADSKFLLGVMGGDPPDVMAQWNPVIPVWADDGLIVPLDDLMSPSEKATFDREAYPVVKKIGGYKGKLYGMSIGVNMTGIYYRPDDLRAAGVDPATAFRSLESLTEAGKRLDVFDRSHNLKRMGWAPADIRFFAPLFGGGFYDERTGRLTIDTPANRRALTYLVQERRRLGYDQVVRFNAGLNTASSAAGWPFIDGAFAATPAGQWYVKQVADYAPHLDYATVPVPPPAGGVARAGMSGGNFMIVPRGAKEARGAWDFVKFWSGLSDPERAAPFYVMGGWLPLTPAVANAKAYREYIRKHPQFETFVDLMSSDAIQVLPPVPYQQFLNDAIGKMEDAALRGTASPEGALKDLQATVDAEVKRRRELGE